MNFKKKFKRVLAISMAFSMVFCSNTFATSINVANSTEDVKTDTLDKTQGTDYFADETNNNWQDGELLEEVRVSVDLASQFTITIPKEIVLDGETGKADYKVKAVGDIAGNQVLIVVPDSDFILSEKGGKDDQIAIVTQLDTEYTYKELKGTGTEYDGNISATLSAGEWSGKFNFNIDFKANAGPVLPAKASFNDMSWFDIATVSEARLADEYFNIGDEKELQIGDETYHVQILGFDHDDKSDGTGKAGITVGLKEIMTTEYVMNSTYTNVGGWRDCEMRTYLQNDILPTLPSDLQSVIKTVNKLTSDGTTSIVTTSDNLFLLSEVEVSPLIQPQGILSISGEGYKYEYFTDNISRNKKQLNGNNKGYWLRSPVVYSGWSNCFGNIGSDGGNYANSANHTYNGNGGGVVFGFCI